MCEYLILGICFAPAGPDSQLQIFGFSEFIASLALMVLVYNYSDTVYKFRTSIAPLKFRETAFGAILSIGIASLLNDIWASQRWIAPSLGLNHSIIQFFLALGFLAVIGAWLFFAFISPPTFSRLNSATYLQSLYTVALNGSTVEVGAIAKEVDGSVAKIIEYLPRTSGTRKDLPASHEQAANDILLLLASRRFARQIALTAPSTLISIAQELKLQDGAVGAASRVILSVIEESLKDKDSIIYAETEEFSSDLIGLVKPVTTSIFADYDFVEKLGRGGRSPLDIDFRIFWNADADQFKAYCSLLKTVIRSFVETGSYRYHSFVISRALTNLEQASLSLHKLNGLSEISWDSKEYTKLRETIDVINFSLDELEKIEGPYLGMLRRKKDDHSSGSFLDELARLAFEIIFSASSVTEPVNLVWTIHHNTIWSPLLSWRKDSRVGRQFRFKISRMLYDEILEMEKYPNFRSARLLGYLLNILGTNVPEKGAYGKEFRALSSAVISWTSRNYLTLRENSRRVADAVMLGGISFDEDNSRIVKTFAQGTRDKPSERYLNLAPSRGGSWP